VLKWIFERLEGKAGAKATAIGNLPADGALDVNGLDISAENLTALLSVDSEVWSEEAALIPPFYDKFADRLPKALWEEYDALLGRLQAGSGDAKRVAAG
jgi:phosphoenolpyruvate carboxykinase (GTP)